MCIFIQLFTTVVKLFFSIIQSGIFFWEVSLYSFSSYIRTSRYINSSTTNFQMKKESPDEEKRTKKKLDILYLCSFLQERRQIYHHSLTRMNHPLSSTSLKTRRTKLLNTGKPSPNWLIWGSKNLSRQLRKGAIFLR